jgi:hypothetical protein
LGGATIGETVFTYVYIESRTWKVVIYMEAFRHTLDSSFFLNHSPQGLGGATIVGTVFTYYVYVENIFQKNF